MIALVLLVGCGGQPYGPYWEEPAVAPQFGAIVPSGVADARGGQTAVIQGSRLDGTAMVSLGGRNAQIVAVSSDAVEIVVPAGVAGGGLVDVSLVTERGAFRAEQAFTYDPPERAWLADEVVSASLVRLDCPVEISGYDEISGVEDRLFWCGIEMGEAWASGWIGDGPQPGVAGDLGGVVPVSSLPEPGEWLVYPRGTAPPQRPRAFGVRAADETIRVTTDQRFGRHLDFIAERQTLLQSTYSLYDDVVEQSGPVATQWNQRSCWVGDLAVVDGAADTLTLEAVADDRTVGLWLGYNITEDIDSELFLTEGFTGTAVVDALDGDQIISVTTGAELAYDEFSGGFSGTGVAGLIGLSDVLPEVEYDVSTVRLGQETVHGAALGAFPLSGVAPDPMTGQLQVDRDAGLVVSWDAPPAVEDDPSYLAVEIKVYDTDIDDPDWLTEMVRVVARGDDAAGTLTVPAAALAALPAAPNLLTGDDDFTGLWGEITVVRHQLRRVALADGSGFAVIDFVHAAQGPARIE